MGSRPLKGDEAEQMLKAADLKALPAVFYAGEHGLSLVVKEGPKNVVNAKAEIAKEVLDYLKSEHTYGNKDTRMGKSLEQRFGRHPLWLGTRHAAVDPRHALSAGEMEITYQGIELTPTWIRHRVRRLQATRPSNCRSFRPASPSASRRSLKR